MIRIGFGFDTHQLCADRPLIIGSVHIPHSQGCLGHSDADVLIHAVMDALLGAAALGDIGGHFPASDPQYKDADSCKLLELVIDLLCQRKWVVTNIDSVVIAEEPRLAEYIPQMRERIAVICGVSAENVSVKATTEEGLGLGGQGIGAKVIVCIESSSNFSSES
jgi:2-C-methyl-D-erythritol 2,4-cyclodiphosphate synthase